MWRRHRAHIATELDGFTGLERIEERAFAEVFRAVERSTGRPVALKVLKVGSVHPSVVEAFHEGARALAAVGSHPNIVTLYRATTTPDGRPALVLELCRGTLAARLRSAGPVTARDAVALGIKLAGALETAHRAGFVHGDVKPGAVHITEFGEPALSDFGEQLLLSVSHVEGAGSGQDLVHAPPEVLEDKPRSAATDVYGLASTLYEAVSGRAPFSVYEGESPASVILRILRDPVPPLRGDDLPLSLADLLDVSLSKEPSIRPATAAGLGEALRAVEDSNGWAATRYVMWGEGPPWRTIPTPPVWPPEAAALASSGPAATAPAGPSEPAASPAPLAPAPAVAPGPSEPVAAVATPRNVVPPRPAHAASPSGSRRPGRQGLGAPLVPPLPLPAQSLAGQSNPTPPSPWSAELRPWWSEHPAAWSGPPDGEPQPSWPLPPRPEAAGPPGPEPPPPWPANQQPPPWRRPPPPTSPGDWPRPAQATPRWSPPEGGWPPPSPPPRPGWPVASEPAPPLLAGSRKRRWWPRREPKGPSGPAASPP